MTLFTFNIIRMLIFTAITSIIAFLAAPRLIVFLRRIKFWKKMPAKKRLPVKKPSVFHSLHKERETSVPRGGGLLIWTSVLLVALFFSIISAAPDWIWQSLGVSAPWWFVLLDFLSREQVWLPLFALVVGSLIGLADDILTIYGGGKYIGGGITFKRRLLAVATIGLVGGWWFYKKLGYETMHIPLLGNFPGGIDVFYRLVLYSAFCDRDVGVLGGWRD